MSTRSARGGPAAPGVGAVERPGRGRAPLRSRAEIVATAVELADREGLDAVTMRAVAGALGTGAASLYRYVDTRDELVDLMVDQVNGEFDLDGSDPRPWTEQMLGVAHQARSIYRRHPWMLTALQATRALGPHGLAYLEHVLAVLEASGADGRARLEAVGVFGALVRLLSQEDIGRSADTRPAAQANVLAARLERAASSGSYPHLADALRDAGPVEGQFDRVLLGVLTGLVGADG